LFRARPRELALLAYYANSIVHLLPETKCAGRPDNRPVD
jgi:hypothetical protein